MPLFHYFKVSPGQGGQLGLAEADGAESQVALSYGRVLGGVGLVVLPIIAAFVARMLDWSDGASAFLHMAELAFGGLVGLVLGERLGLGAQK